MSHFTPFMIPRVYVFMFSQAHIWKMADKKYSHIHATSYLTIFNFLSTVMEILQTLQRADLNILSLPW